MKHNCKIKKRILDKRGFNYFLTCGDPWCDEEWHELDSSIFHMGCLNPTIENDDDVAAEEPAS